MTVTLDTDPHAARTDRRPRLTAVALILAGLTFSAGGAMHPTDSGHGNKTQQLHEMLVDSNWYPAHALLLASMALFSLGLFLLRERPGSDVAAHRVIHVVFVITGAATASMAIHLFAALGSDSLADGKPSFVSRLQTVNEVMFDAGWGIAMAVLAVVGGLTSTVGNRLTMVFGVIGGLSYAFASATIPFADTFDPLFRVAAALSVWAILVAVLVLRSGRGR